MEKDEIKKIRDNKEPWILRPAIYIIGALIISFFLVRDFVLPILFSPNPQEYISSLKLQDRCMILVGLLIVSNFLRLSIRRPKTKKTITLKDLKEKLSSELSLPNFLIKNWLFGFKDEGFKRDFSQNIKSAYLFIITFVVILVFGEDTGIQEKLLALFLFLAFFYSLLRVFIWVILPGRMWRRKVILVINKMARLREIHKFDILGEAKAEETQQQLEPSDIFKEMYNKAWEAFEVATILAACRNQYTDLYTPGSKVFGTKDPEPFQASYFYFISLFLALEQKISELDVALKLDKMNEKILTSWRVNMQPCDFGNISAKSAFDIATSFAREVNEFINYGIKYGHKESRIRADEYISVRVKPADARVQTWVEDSLVWIDNELPSRLSWPTKKVLKDYDVIVHRMDEEAYRTLSEQNGSKAQGILAKVKEEYRSTPILELIAQGESHTLEFKETLQYDIYTKQADRNILHSSLKTIAAFLNSDGGTLLIGISDSGEVKGIDRDLQYVGRHNRDGYEQKLRSLLNDRFDPVPRGNVDIVFEELSEGTVCRINVGKNAVPVAFDNDFYIRDGNGTRKLEGRELADWLRQRNNN
jgi:hypothetical protein